MAAQTFTVNNDGNVNLQIVKIVFNTPSGVQHTADLTNFGGSATFTGAEFYPSSLTIATGQSKTFSVDHSYVTGANGTRTGTIVIVPNYGDSVTISTTVVVTGALA